MHIERRKTPTYLAAALALLGPLALTPNSARAQSEEPTAARMAECEQDNVASDALRACTALLNGRGLSEMQRGHVYTLRGIAWMTEDDAAAATADFTRAIAIDGHNVTALKGRAKAYTLTGHHAEAAEDWHTLKRFEPSNDEFHRNRGTSLLAAGRYADALAEYDRSLELNPKGLDAYSGRANVYDALNDREKASKEFDLAIAADPNHLETYWARAEMALRWGEKELAIRNYEKVLQINGVYAHARKALDRLGILHPP